MKLAPCTQNVQMLTFKLVPSFAPSRARVNGVIMCKVFFFGSFGNMCGDFLAIKVWQPCWFIYESCKNNFFRAAALPRETFLNAILLWPKSAAKLRCCCQYKVLLVRASAAGVPLKSNCAFLENFETNKHQRPKSSVQKMFNCYFWNF